MHRLPLLRWAPFILCLVLAPCHAAGLMETDIDGYLAPYVQGHNFSGVVLVAKSDKLLFDRAYGYASLSHRVANTPATRFHIASMSMQFTAAAVMRLVEAGKFGLDTPVEKIVPGITHGGEITVRDLLTETSGLTDINSLPDYAEVLIHPQTPASLVAKIDGKPLLFTPGSKYLHEEHSAYNLLALILEKVTGLSFDAALRREVFAPLGMQSCGADDASGVIVPDLAEGYAPQGVRDLARAPYLDWSAKTGNGSVYCTAADESKWIQGLMHDTLLSAQTRGIMLADSASHVGYGWFTGTSKRFGGPIYYMNGRSPGYASYLAYFPEQQITVVVLSNIYVSVTTQIGGDVAAIALGKPYAAAPPPMGPLDAGTLKGMQGRFSFGADFYQPDAVLTLLTQGGDVFLKWADGSLSPLIPVGPDHFIDRGYWEDVSLARGADGRIVQLVYDRFQGQRISEPAP